ncbi:MAG: hypothetical protein SGPRY_005420, partial [Prymnesium sp.]
MLGGAEPPRRGEAAGVRESAGSLAWWKQQSHLHLSHSPAASSNADRRVGSRGAACGASQEGCGGSDRADPAVDRSPVFRDKRSPLRESHRRLSGGYEGEGEEYGVEQLREALRAARRQLREGARREHALRHELWERGEARRGEGEWRRGQGDLSKGEDGWRREGGDLRRGESPLRREEGSLRREKSWWRGDGGTLRRGEDECWREGGDTWQEGGMWGRASYERPLREDREQSYVRHRALPHEGELREGLGASSLRGDVREAEGGQQEESSCICRTEGRRRLDVESSRWLLPNQGQQSRAGSLECAHAGVAPSRSEAERSHGK